MIEKNVKKCSGILNFIMTVLHSLSVPGWKLIWAACSPLSQYGYPCLFGWRKNVKVTFWLGRVAWRRRWVRWASLPGNRKLVSILPGTWLQKVEEFSSVPVHPSSPFSGGLPICQQQRFAQWCLLGHRAQASTGLIFFILFIYIF